MGEQNHSHCHVQRLQKEVNPKALESSTASVLAITGMGCPNCAARVHNALLSLTGVYWVDVDLGNARACVHWNPAMHSLEDLVDAVSKAAAGTHHNYQAYVLGDH